MLTAKILLTLTTLGYSAIPFAFDSNKTHWVNPSWTGHARFHCVWQVMSYVYIAALVLYLIWTADTAAPLWLAAVLAGCVYGGFWTAVATRSLFGGVLVDEVCGVPPFHWNLFGKRFETDANVTLFSGAVALLAVSTYAISSATL